MKPGAAAAAYDLSLADLGRDRAEIIGLCSSVIEGFTAERYEKYFERNPCGPPLVVRARTETTGELVGVAALHLKQMQLDGEIVTVGVAGDFAVHPAHRVFGPALALQRELTRASVDRAVRLAIGIPGDAAAGVLRRAGYTRVGSSVRLIRPLRLRNVPGLRGRSGRSLRTIAGAMRSRAVTAALEGHSELELGSFDARMEPLLNAARGAAGISLYRSPDFLNWLFELDGGVASGRFSSVAVTRDGSPVAYAVSRVADDVCHLIDLAWLDSAGLAAIVATVLERSLDTGLAAADLFCFGRLADLARMLARLGFFAADGPDIWRPPVWCRGSEATALADPQRWLLFESAFDV